MFFAHRYAILAWILWFSFNLSAQAMETPTPIIMSGEHEVVDLVDRNDNVVGTIIRSQASGNDEIIARLRVVWLFVRNSAGKLWIPRRHPDKKSLPLGLDASVCGCVQSGETYEQAILREIKEEILLDLAPSDITCIGYFNPHDHGVRAWYKVYELVTDAEISYDSTEYCEGYWLTPQEVLQKMAAGDKHKKDLPFLIRTLYLDTKAPVAQ